jgi:hypothetical protein
MERTFAFVSVLRRRASLPHPWDCGNYCRSRSPLVTLGRSRGRLHCWGLVHVFGAAMKLLFASILLLLLAIPLRAQPETVHVIGSCVQDAHKVLDLFAHAEASPKVLYLICTQPEWDKIARIFDKPADVMAFTIFKSRTVVISPKGLDPLIIQKVVTHEAKHLACNCTMGEAY